jgi:hypothetical protein
MKNHERRTTNEDAERNDERLKEDKENENERRQRTKHEDEQPRTTKNEN